ncbi:hypothetical protein ES703_110187 [subsurface metagenome]
MVGILVVADEIFDIPSRVFNTPPTPVNWMELATETFFILVIGSLTIFLLQQLNLRRKRAQEMLYLERDKLATILNCMEDGIYIINTKHDIEYINQAMLSQFGPVKERKCYQYLHNLEEPCPWCSIQSVLEGRSVRRDVYSLKNQKRIYDYS